MNIENLSLKITFFRIILKTPLQNQQWTTEKGIKTTLLNELDIRFQKIFENKAHNRRRSKEFNSTASTFRRFSHFLDLLNENSLICQKNNQDTEQNKTIQWLSGRKLALSSKSVLLKQLNDIINIGNDLGFWELNLVPTIEALPRNINPLGTHKEWQAYLFAKELNATHQSYLTQQSRISDPTFPLNAALGMIILDLIFESAVLNHKTLMRLIGQLSNPENYHYQNKRLFFLIQEDRFNSPKRVFISQQTELLIYRYANRSYIERLLPKLSRNYTKLERETYDEFFFKSLHALFMLCIRAYLKELNIPRHLFPTSVNGWCSLGEKSLYSKYPPLMIQYARGKLRSHSLRLNRLQTIFNLPLSTPLEQENQDSDFEPSEELTPYDTSYAFKTIRKFLDRKSKHQDAKKLLNEMLSDAQKIQIHSPNHKLLFDWSLSLLKLDKNHFAVSPQKILAKFSSITRLLVSLTEIPITELSSEQRALLFTRVSQLAISEINLNTIQSNLRAFNHWIETSYGVEPLPDKVEVFGDPKLTNMTVNTNLITFDEYLHILSILKSLIASEAQELKPLYRLMQAIFILGFRCGLRSKEVVELKFNDWIECDAYPILIIRESYDRDLKTINAKRQLELKHLLNKPELAIIREEVGKTQNLISTYTVANDENDVSDASNPEFYLFNNGQDITKPVNASKIKTPLMQIIRDVCKDESIKFHHLRHSFATWNFLSSFLAEFDIDIKDAQFFQGLARTEQWLEHAKNRKLNQVPTIHKSKKAPFWLAQKMGHLEFSTTLEHYIHAADIALMLFQAKLNNERTAKEWHDISGISINYLHKQKSAKATFAAHSFIPNDLKKRLKISTLAHKNWTFIPGEVNRDNLPKPTPEFAFKTSPIFTLIELYHTACQLQEEPERDTKFDVIIRFFKNRPKLRARPLNIYEINEMNRLTEKFFSLYGQDMDTDDANHVIRHQINTVFAGITPNNASKEILAPQTDLQWLSTDHYEAKEFIEVISKLELDFMVYVHLKKPIKKDDALINNQKTNFWIKKLGLASDKFIKVEHYKASTGSPSRIEIRPLNRTSKKNYTFFYLWINLYLNFNNETSEYFWTNQIAY